MSDHLEEMEVLKSIFDGDEHFKISNDKNFTVQYLLGESNDSKSFLLEFEMIENYPAVSGPKINLDLFYNKKLVTNVKENIFNRLTTECEQYLGSPMIYSLIEFAKENLDELLTDQPDQLVVNQENDNAENDNVQSKGPSDKKEQLSKAQKRKMWNRGEGGGEKERGWNWVDIVKHLSQTGGDIQS